MAEASRTEPRLSTDGGDGVGSRVVEPCRFATDGEGSPSVGPCRSARLRDRWCDRLSDGLLARRGFTPPLSAPPQALGERPTPDAASSQKRMPLAFIMSRARCWIALRCSSVILGGALGPDVSWRQ